VAQIYVVKNDDEAVKLANDSHYGLGGAVFSQDIEARNGWRRGLKPGWSISTG
jgi:succinate-semialdehyde dehydrogenase/glutarate-semialdehyde dehydrogenase